ncbi:MAG: SufE family protein [Gammaproteobacteria bacterium]|nr:SufE family protein [Gammaproteobacteria bacterium]
MALLTLTAIIDQAKKIPDRDNLAQWIRDQGKYAPNNTSIRDMKNFVPGCEHPVWISYTLNGSGVNFDISCDGADSQGVAGIVVQALGGLTARETRAINFAEFREIARYLNNRQQRTLNAILNKIKDTIGDP